MPRSADFQKSRGEHQRRRILAALENGPMSSQELADKIHLTRKGVLLHIRVLRAQKAIRIADSRMQSRTREIPVYGLGGAPDAKYVRLKHRDKPNALEQQRAKVRGAILDQLRIGRATSTELAALLDYSGPTMRKYLALMRADNLIYRADWVKRENSGGSHVAVWAIGNRPDKPVPKVAKARVLPKLPREQFDKLKRKRLAKEVMREATSKKSGIFAALGL